MGDEVETQKDTPKPKDAKDKLRELLASYGPPKRAPKTGNNQSQTKRIKGVLATIIAVDLMRGDSKTADDYHDWVPDVEISSLSKAFGSGVANSGFGFFRTKGDKAIRIVQENVLLCLPFVDFAQLLAELDLTAEEFDEQLRKLPTAE